MQKKLKKSYIVLHVLGNSENVLLVLQVKFISYHRRDAFLSFFVCLLLGFKQCDENFVVPDKLQKNKQKDEGKERKHET